MTLTKKEIEESDRLRILFSKKEIDFSFKRSRTRKEFEYGGIEF